MNTLSTESDVYSIESMELTTVHIAPSTSKILHLYSTSPMDKHLLLVQMMPVAVYLISDLIRFVGCMLLVCVYFVDSLLTHAGTYAVC